MPVLVQPVLVLAAMVACVLQLPIEGNVAGMVPRSEQASLDRKGYGTVRDT